MLIECRVQHLHFIKIERVVSATYRLAIQKLTGQ